MRATTYLHNIFGGKHFHVAFLYVMACCYISLPCVAQVKWDGESGDGQWTTASNWLGDILPGPTDDVLLDNSILAGNYTISLPTGTNPVLLHSLVISPANGSSIQLTIPPASTALPALSLTAPGYGIKLNNGATLVNASGNTAGAVITIVDSFRINNGGHYIHNTRASHAALVTALSRSPGTEWGVFTFDVPGGSYTFSATSRVYGTLEFSSAASGGSQAYNAVAANHFTINGNLLIHPGVAVNLDITANTTIKGSLLQDGGIFNLASQPNNNTVFIKSDLLQTAGTITETSTGQPYIELNGTARQTIQLKGGLVNSVGLRINNPAGISLGSDIALPWLLDLKNGVVDTRSWFLTLLAGCSILADSTSNGSFVDGPIRKEKLSGESHFLFPVGKGGRQRWLELKNPVGSFTVAFFPGDPRTLSSTTGPGIHHISSLEYWSVDADANPPASAAIELSFDNVNSGGVTNTSALRVVQLNAGIWTDIGNSVTTGSAGASGSVVSNLLPSIAAGTGYFTLASSDAFMNPLPLKLLSFNAIPSGVGAELRWTTTGEWSNGYFELMSGVDGEHFNRICRIPTNNGQSDYLYKDSLPLQGIRYYQLKLVQEGSVPIYSKTLALYQRPERGFSVWPTITSGTIHIQLPPFETGRCLINITDMSGRNVWNYALPGFMGSNIQTLELHTLPPGIYLISIYAGKGTLYRTRFVKTN